MSERETGPCSFAGCSRKFRARGLCAVHYNQRREGREMVPLPGDAGYVSYWDRTLPVGEAKIASDTERFWSHVDRSGECWEWTGYLHQYGYGQTWWGNRRARSHRVAYIIANGSIPDGAAVDHMCHNRACVNPSHLRAVTAKQNQENRSGAQSNSASGIRGVRWDERAGKWTASVKHNYKAISVGSFDTAEEAEAAVVTKRNELFTHNDMDRSDQ